MSSDNVSVSLFCDKFIDYDFIECRLHTLPKHLVRQLVQPFASSSRTHWLCKYCDHCFTYIHWIYASLRHRLCICASCASFTLTVHVACQRFYFEVFYISCVNETVFTALRLYEKMWIQQDFIQHLLLWRHLLVSCQRKLLIGWHYLNMITACLMTSRLLLLCLLLHLCFCCSVMSAVSVSW